MYVYKKTQSDPDLWTVGFYEPGGKWIPESDHRTEEAAAMRVRRLNEGYTSALPESPAEELASTDTE